MSTLDNRPNTALLVIGVQNGIRRACEGSDNWRIVPELAPDDAEPLVDKNYPDSFEETALVVRPSRRSH